MSIRLFIQLSVWNRMNVVVNVCVFTPFFTPFCFHTLLHWITFWDVINYIKWNANVISPFFTLMLFEILFKDVWTFQSKCLKKVRSLRSNFTKFHQFSPNFTRWCFHVVQLSKCEVSLTTWQLECEVSLTPIPRGGVKFQVTVKNMSVGI